MCADPKMQRLLMAELRSELAARKAARKSGMEPNRWHVATLGIAAPAICLVILVITLGI
jgi:hypothetical protein